MLLTDQALVLASPLFSAVASAPARRGSDDLEYHHSAQQVDVVPTIAALFGTGVPARSCGIVLEPVLEALRGRVPVDDLRRANFAHLRRLTASSSADGTARQLQSDLLAAFDVPALRDLVPGIVIMLLAVVIGSRVASPSSIALLFAFVYAALMVRPRRLGSAEQCSSHRPSSKRSTTSGSMLRRLPSSCSSGQACENETARTLESSWRWRLAFGLCVNGPSTVRRALPQSR